MKSTHTTIKTMIILALVFIGFAWLTISYAAEDIRVKSYDISTGSMKTDMQRMVEAYESLSNQYLSLVQQQLQNMNSADRQILQKLDNLERRFDSFEKKVDLLIRTTVPSNQIPAPGTPKPVITPNTSEKIDSSWTQPFQKEQGLK